LGRYSSFVSGRVRPSGHSPSRKSLAYDVLLRGHFDDEAVHPLGLLLAALPPTIIAALAFRFL
jgi:hypothetical protein